MVYTLRPETILYMLGFLSFLMIFVIDSLSAYMYIYIYIYTLERIVGTIQATSKKNLSKTFSAGPYTSKS